MRGRTIVFTVGSILLTYMSCSKNDINVLQIDPPEDIVVTNFHAEIEGIPLDADEVIVTEVSFIETTVISITARNTSTNQSLIIQFPATLTAGSHQYDLMSSATMPFGSYQPDAISAVIFTSTSGVMSIINNDANENFVEASTFFTAVETTVGSVIEVTFCEFALQY